MSGALAVKSYDDCLADMLSWIVIHSPQITDLSEGSVTRSIVEGVALGSEEIYVAVYVAFLAYLKTIKTDVYALEQKKGTYASGLYTFSRLVLGDAVAIPSGAKVQTETGLAFVTTAEASIASDSLTSTSVPIIATSIGFAYNVNANTITVLSSSLDGVDGGTNTVGTSGGTDKETAEQFDLRFQQYLEGLGGSNKAALQNAALELEGITSAKITENNPPISNVDAYLYVDNGTPTGATVVQVAAVQAAIDGSGTTTDPGARACGVNIEARAASIITQNLGITVYVQDANVNQLAIRNQIESLLTSYIANLGIGGNIAYGQLTTLCMSVSGVTDAKITTPTGNVIIDDTQVARAGTYTFNFIIQAL